MKNLIYLFIAVALAGCGTDDGGTPQSTIGNVLVVNEGNFAQTNGSITAYNADSEEVSKNLFQAVNNRPLGDVVQSLFIDEANNGYVVVNNSRKIEIVNAADFSSTATIEEGLANPRYLVRTGDQLFVSNWGNFDENYQLDQSYVLVLDAATYENEGSIATENGTENLVYSNGFIYASNSFTNSVSVIDVAEAALLTTLEVGFSPGEMVVDNTGMVWLICGGSYQANDGAIYRLDNDSAEKEVDLGVNPVARLTMNKASGVLYFIVGNVVGKYETNATSLTTDFITNGEAVGLWGVGYNEAEEVLYIADAKGFQGNGTIYRYSGDGELLSAFGAGVGPNAFVFLND